MKASELRIGNLVTWLDEENPNNAILNLIGIVLNDCLWVEWEWEDGQKDNTDIDLESIKPIPLTEEWLLKFGFSRSDKGSISAQFNLGINPVTNDNMIQLIWLKNLMTTGYSLDGFPFYTNGHFEIRYVHQLQNLYFALTGEELTIKDDVGN